MLAMLGKKSLYIAAAVAIIAVIVMISDVNKAYVQRREYREKLAQAVTDNNTMRATIDSMSLKLKAREDENVRIREQEKRSVEKLDDVLRQNRDWSGSGVPGSIADGLRDATSH